MFNDIQDKFLRICPCIAGLKGRCPLSEYLTLEGGGNKERLIPLLFKIFGKVNGYIRCSLYP